MSVFRNSLRHSSLYHFLRRCVFLALCQHGYLTKRASSQASLVTKHASSIVLSGPLRGLRLVYPPNFENPTLSLGQFEPHVVAAIHQFVRPGDTVFDIGANIGYHSFHASVATGRHGRVYSFEPDPSNFAALSRSIQFNRVQNIKALPLAVSSSAGKAKLATFRVPEVSHILNEDTPSDAVTVEVETDSIDSFVRERGNRPPRFIKIDVEGGELAVLRGALQVIGENRPIIVAEVWHRNLSDVTQILSQFDYHCQPLNKSSWGGDYIFCQRGAAACNEK